MLSRSIHCEIEPPRPTSSTENPSICCRKKRGAKNERQAQKLLRRPSGLIATISRYCSPDLRLNRTFLSRSTVLAPLSRIPARKRFWRRYSVQEDSNGLPCRTGLSSLARAILMDVAAYYRGEHLPDRVAHPRFDRRRQRCAKCGAGLCRAVDPADGHRVFSQAKKGVQ